MISADNAQVPPDLQVRQWFNTDKPITLSELRGKVVAIEAFQMLCPGCINHGIPQAQRIHATFPKSLVAVIGLHTVFEHHAAMEPVSLQAFLFEYGINFPVAVDAAGENNPTPKTMQAWGQRGTPTLWPLDRSGRLRSAHLGQVHDMAVGAEIATLICEQDSPAAQPLSDDHNTSGACRPTREIDESARK